MTRTSKPFHVEPFDVRQLSLQVVIDGRVVFAQLVRNRRKVGLFNVALTRHLPKRINDWVENSRTWFDDYLKVYRDALAHRIPVYIPPSELSPADGERFAALEREKVDCLRGHNFDRIEAIDREQAALSRPSFMFLGAFSIEEDSGQGRPLYLHPQMLTDAVTVLDFIEVFLANWHERSDLPA